LSSGVSQFAYDTFAATTVPVSSTSVRTSTGGGPPCLPSLPTSSGCTFIVAPTHSFTWPRFFGWEPRLGVKVGLCTFSSHGL
jgi:hypothetical protein